MEGCEDMQFKQHTITKFFTAEKIPHLTFITVCRQCMGLSIDVSTVRCWVQEFKQEEMGEACLCGEANDCNRWVTSWMCWRNDSGKWSYPTETLFLNWESLKREWNSLSTFSDSRKFVPGGYQKTDRWDESWKSQSSKGISGSFWREKCEMYMADSDRWWNLGPSLWSWEHKNSLWYTATKNHQHQRNSKSKSPLVVMLTVFWNPKYVLFTDFLKNDATVNLKLCTENLKNLEKCITRKKAEIYDILFQQDKARPHTSATITDAIVCLGFTVLPHTAYSLDLAPGDYHLFLKVKEELRCKTSSLIKKQRLRYASGFGRKEKTFLRTEFKYLSSIVNSVLKLEEIIWKSDYAQL